jgi:hypothetical protein
MSNLSLSDAAVAIRSFPRRFAESIQGPFDDPAWMRILMRPSDSAPSPITMVQTTTAMLDDLATTFAALPRLSTPATTARPVVADLNDMGPDPRTTIDQLMSDLNRAANVAAESVEARRHDDVERSVLVDGKAETVATYLTSTVSTIVLFLRSMNQLQQLPD